MEVKNSVFLNLKTGEKIMKIRLRLLSMALVLTSGLLGCTHVSKISDIEFSPGLKSTLGKLPEDSAVIILTPEGKSFFTNTEGKLASPCTAPRRVERDGKQIAIIEKSTCIGLKEGYFVESVNSEAILKTFRNPHGCLYCYMRKNIDGVYEQVCRPNGCDVPH